MNLVEGMLLYHGSYTAVEKIDINKCAAGKDFGKGFYVTSDLDQAKNFIKTSLLKAKTTRIIPADQNFGFVTTYRYHQIDKTIPCYNFADADKDWLWFIAINRRKNLAEALKPMLSEKLFKSEIISGKIANDTTNTVLTAYLNGLYGEIKDMAAADMAINFLLPNKLKDQYCFLSERAISCLEFVEVKKYELY